MALQDEINLKKRYLKVSHDGSFYIVPLDEWSVIVAELQHIGDEEPGTMYTFEVVDW